MNVEDDLWSRWCPLKVTSDTNPQFVDICVFAIIRRDGQRVGYGQQLRDGEISLDWSVSDRTKSITLKF